MSGVSPSPAEHHLGDRLAALVDGELNHDTRERVLAHLATCARCKAEADAQRRLKSLFVEAAPPPPSEGLLARLQMLPGGGDGGYLDPVRSAFPVREIGPDTEPDPTRFAFPVHEVGVAQRGGGARGRRFAFAAAGAVSLAAIALGGAGPVDSLGDPAAPRGEGVNPVRPGLLSVSDRQVLDGRDPRRTPAAPSAHPANLPAIPTPATFRR
ncbi:anti-sigma factor family protein [Streptomyces sp. NPDC093225]|uniref:anti-sigma factor family protein n=1 Tax=Streptomyces sp. NPDC093225 TaxID=3366034 RepID=UPI0038221846